MSRYNIPFSPPDISNSEIEQVIETLRSGWITTGPKTKLLEKRINDWIGSARCVCLNSQTACAEMTLRALGVGPGDEVITCAYSYTASASVVCHVGAKLVLVDCLNNSPEIDYNAIENAITENTKVVVPIDIAGVPCDYSRIFDIVRRKQYLFQPKNEIQDKIGRVVVMADTAHALGATLHDKMIGNIADFSNFSFHAVKNLTTAEGGAVTWRHIDGVNDDELYHLFQLLSLHGQSKDALAKTKLGAWEYDVIGTWYKCNMTDVAAAIGLAQLDRYPQMLKRRREIIGKYDAAFQPYGIKRLTHYSHDYSSSGHLYLTWIPGITQEQRNDIIVKMAEAGVACNVHYKPFPMHTAYKKMGFKIEDYPNSYSMFVNEITLPLYTLLSDDEVQFVIETYINTIKGYIK